MDILASVLVPIAICVVLPIVLASMYFVHKKHESDNRTKIIMTALEKNVDIDIEALTKKMNTPDRLLKEKLLRKEMWGLITFFLGCGLLGFATFLMKANMGGSNDSIAFTLFGLAFMGIGIALLISFASGKKLLAKEMEAEEKEKTARQ